MPLDTEQAQHHVKRFNALKNQRTTVQTVWQAIETYIATGQGKFFRESQGEHGIDWYDRRVFDATAPVAYKRLASSVHGSLTNPSFMWFDMRWRSKELRDNHEAKVWLEKAAKRVYYELQDSNFNLAVTAGYRDLTSFGTAAITLEALSDTTEAWRGLNFTHVPLKEVYFEPGTDGRVHAFYRNLRWRASKLVDKFGMDKLPDKVKRLYESATDAEVSVIFVVWPRDTTTPPDVVMLPSVRPYGWAYILTDDATVIDEGGYYEMPAVVPRWQTQSESMWGHSPSHDALGDILTLNEMVMLDIKAREKVIDPAIMAAERALINRLSLAPGTVNVVRDPDKIKPFESAARFDSTESAIVRLRNDIQSHYYIDQLELKESPAMTATEVQVRYEAMQKLLAETMSRLKEELLDPIVQRTFNLLYRAGELGSIPAAANKQAYDIQYIGPLSRAQRFDQSASIERWVTQLQLIAQAGDEAQKVLLVPDYDRIARAAAEQLNLPTEFTRNPEDVKKDIDNQNQQQARTAASQAAQAEAQAVKDLRQAEQLQQGEPNIAATTTG